MVNAPSGYMVNAEIYFSPQLGKATRRKRQRYVKRDVFSYLYNKLQFNSRIVLNRGVKRICHKLSYSVCAHNCEGFMTIPVTHRVFYGRSVTLVSH
jgi:hypothetical protein